MKLKKISLVVIVGLLVLFEVASSGSSDASAKKGVGNSKDTDAITLHDNKGIEGEYPGQYTLDEFEGLTGEKLALSGNPLFSSMTDDVKERLPVEALVLAPENEIGQYGGTLRVVSRAPESGTSGVLSIRHANLIRMSGDYQTIVPDVAESFEYNDDYTELTFKLREGHKWSDGHPFTTEDILFWWEDIQKNPGLNSNIKAKWKFGGEPMNLRAIDDTTIVFEFAVPSPGFILMLAADFTQPYQPKHVLSQFHKTYNPDADELAESLGYKSWEILFYVYYHDWKDTYHPLSGHMPTHIPTLESHVLYEETSEHRKFKANPYYHAVDTEGNQLPYIDELYEVFIEDTEVKNLKISQGEVDYKAQGMDLLDYPYLQRSAEKGDYTVTLAINSTSSAAPGFNLNHKDPVLKELFNNLKFKQAMSLAINRDEINELIYLGTGKPMAITPGAPERTDFVTEEMTQYMIEYDPERANALLDEIGLKKNANGQRLRSDGKELVIYLTYSTQGGAARLWQLLEEYWEALGVRVELKEVNTDLYNSDLNNNNLDLSAWGPEGTEPPKFYEIDRTPFLPTGVGSAMAIDWARWIKTGGAEGETPPPHIIELNEMYTEFTQKGYRSDEYNELGAKMAEIVVEQMFLIGTVGDTKSPVVYHNRMGNVITLPISGFPYYYNYPIRPSQWYIKY